MNLKVALIHWRVGNVLGEWIMSRASPQALKEIHLAVTQTLQHLFLSRSLRSSRKVHHNKRPLPVLAVDILPCSAWRHTLDMEVRYRDCELQVSAQMASAHCSDFLTILQWFEPKPEGIETWPGTLCEQQTWSTKWWRPNPFDPSECTVELRCFRGYHDVYLQHILRCAIKCMFSGAPVAGNLLARLPRHQKKSHTTSQQKHLRHRNWDKSWQNP